MKKFAFLLLIIFFISSCSSDEGRCPLFCDDQKICTFDWCSEATEFICVYDSIENCCYTDEDCQEERPYCIKNGCSDDSCELASDCPTQKPYCIEEVCYEFECIFDRDCDGGKCVDGVCV